VDNLENTWLTGGDPEDKSREGHWGVRTKDGSSGASVWTFKEDKSSSVDTLNECISGALDWVLDWACEEAVCREKADVVYYESIKRELKRRLIYEYGAKSSAR
jgi:hypothetical protein